MAEIENLLAENDPQGLAVAKAGLEALRARYEIEKEMKREELEEAG